MRITIIIVQFFLTSVAVAKRGETGDWRVSFKGKGFSENTYATRHEDVVLECEAGGSPSPTIHWLKNGERMQQVRFFLKNNKKMFCFVKYIIFHN